ncbi:MAG: amidohydrolase family protein [Spirochaetes bacterium]|nr:amidohydrolase family protein [Spirochaetota bacterium]MBU1080761.1 amidohydrolase family protein [Spirochaetota bacterium]
MQTTIPLLHDNHNHVALYAAFSACVDISKASAAEALAILRALPRERLTVVRGWKSFELPLDASALRELPPILLINFSLHGFVVSDEGIPFVERVVPEVALRRNDQAWCEANVPAIFAAYCGLTGIDERRLRAYIDALVPLGIGSSDEMTVPTKEAVDICTSSTFSDRIRPWVSPALYEELDTPRRARLSGIKLYLDGAVGARSAAIAGPWIGAGKAMFTYSDAELVTILERIGAYGTGVSMHAIGELAIEQALACVTEAVRRGARFDAVRLEHVQFIDKAQASRARDLGATLSMQPNFSSDSKDYVDRLSGEYLRRNNPFRMLIDEVGYAPGADLIFGSDGMPDGIAYAATESLFPAYPSQRLSLEELVAGYGPARGVAGAVTLDVDERAGRVTVAGSAITAPAPRRL